jgi:hypothetical protein
MQIAATQLKAQFANREQRVLRPVYLFFVYNNFYVPTYVFYLTILFILVTRIVTISIYYIDIDKFYLNKIFIQTRL